MLSPAAGIGITTLELDQLPKQMKKLVEILPPCSTYLEKQTGRLETFSVLNPDVVSYSDFYSNYLLANRPCLFTSEITREWGVMREWTTVISPNAGGNDSNSRTINFQFLAEHFGECDVGVTNCDKLGDQYEGDGESMKLREYVNYLQTFCQAGYPTSMPCLYLKDWHIARANDNPNSTLPMYSVPKFFASDWLNETAVEQGDDFRFVYMGPKGSWSPFHSDVYGSFSWSANVIGTKKWMLYPPGHEKKFIKNGKMKFDAENPGVAGEDFYEIIQTSGQVIFVPSGWHHIVWNLEDTISINQNWMNACNVGYIWANMKAALCAVQAQLDDLKGDPEFDNLCQQLLKANHGMNYEDLYTILTIIVTNRHNGRNYPDEYQYGAKHLEFDLSVANFVLETIFRLIK